MGAWNHAAWLILFICWGQHIGGYKIDKNIIYVGNDTPVKLECVVEVSGIGRGSFYNFLYNIIIPH